MSLDRPIITSGREARITTSGLPIPIPRPAHEAPKEFVHRFLVEHRTTNPQVTPNEVASAALNAMRSADHGWYRSRIVEFYEVKENNETPETETSV